MSGSGVPVVSVGRAASLARRPRAGLPFVGLLGVAALNAHAQTESTTTARSFLIVPDLSIVQTLTDNSALSATDRRPDSITQVNPSLQISSNTGRLQGFFNYALSGLYYARGTESNAVQQSLSSAIKAEVVQNFASVDATANVSRQNISALGTQSPDSSLQSSNQTQVSSVSLSPYLHGQLGSYLAYQVRASYATTHTGSDAIGNSTNESGSLHLGSDAASARMNWAADLSRQVSDFTMGRRTVADSEVASLILRPDSDLQFSARGGREANDYVTVDRVNRPTYGFGLRWTPSERTTLSIDGDKHSYGNSYAINFQHRTAHTVWTFTDTRSVSTAASASSQSPVQTAQSLLNLLLSSQFPDPVLRQQQVLIELQTLGINPNAVIPAGFLSSSASLQKSQTLSFAYLGSRTSLMLSAQESDTRALDPASSSIGSLANGDAIHQRVLSVTVSQRLTPISSGNLSLSKSYSTDLTSGLHVNLLTISPNWSTGLGPRTRLSLSARHSISDGGTQDYTESAILATFTLQF